MWYNVKNEAEIFTPSVLIYPDRVEENIRRMIAIAGDVSRLRPHIKTHKIAEVVRLQVKHNITKFKCATLSEVELVANNGGKDILLAYPLLGPGIKRFIDIIVKFPDVKFAVTVDSLFACQELSREAENFSIKLDVFIDIDNGMHRTGIPPSEAMSLVDFIELSDWLFLRGLHIYDGHIHESEIAKRKKHCDADFEAVNQLLKALEEKGIKSLEIACGGTFTFPLHARHRSRTLCPGTPIFWDGGYEKAIPDLDFLPAAVLAGRVISKPDHGICIDFGHKSMASEMSHPRVHFLNLEVDKVINHSEEHLVISTNTESNISIGAVVYALPHHVCPTIALHEQVYVVRDNMVVGTWEVAARKRVY